MSSQPRISEAKIAWAIGHLKPPTPVVKTLPEWATYACFEGDSEWTPIMEWATENGYRWPPDQNSVGKGLTKAKPTTKMGTSSKRAASKRRAS